MDVATDTEFDVLDPVHSAYSVLGLSPTCSNADIQRKFVALSLLFRSQMVSCVGTDAAHVAEMSLLRVNKCAELLSVPSRRFVYDMENGFTTPLPRVSVLAPADRRRTESGRRC
jgi:preprotein translocase subunit Sec63